VQVAALRDHAAAAELLRKMEAKYGAGRLVERDDHEVWRVLVGLGSSKSASELLAKEIRMQDSLPALSVPEAAVR
jgi:hypothetical protein